MKKRYNQGSTMVSSLIVVLLLLSVIGIVLSIAASYHRRSLNEYARKQAYLNATYVAESIAGQLNDEQNSATFLPISQSDVVKITDVKLPVQEDSAKVTAQISFDSKNTSVIYIQVQSQYASISQEVQLIMRLYQDKWYKWGYTDIGEEYNANQK